MIAVLINTATVLLGSLLGLLCKKAIPVRVSGAVMLALGLCTIYIGVDGMLAGNNTLVLILTMILAAIIGTLLDLDGKISYLGDWIERRSKKTQEEGSSIAAGFITASLLFCIGAMTIIGALNAGLQKDYTMLITKSIMDLFSAMMLAASMGFGVMCAAVFVLVFEGGLVLLSQLVAPVLTTEAVAEITCVGSLMILALGLNLIGVTKIKVANFLPAIVLSPLVLALYQWASALVAGLL